MSPARKVLLARPHAFVVDDMQKFVARLGFEPVRLGDIDQLRAAADASVRGVVISTAIASEVDATFAHVYTEVRRVLPNVPIVASSLTDYATAAEVVRSELGKLGKVPTLIEATVASTTQAGLGTPHAIVLLRKEDLRGVGSPAERLIAAHFR